MERGEDKMGWGVLGQEHGRLALDITVNRDCWMLYDRETFAIDFMLDTEEKSCKEVLGSDSSTDLYIADRVTASSSSAFPGEPWQYPAGLEYWSSTGSGRAKGWTRRTLGRTIHVPPLRNGDTTHSTHTLRFHHGLLKPASGIFWSELRI